MYVNIIQIEHIESYTWDNNTAPETKTQQKDLQITGQHSPSTTSSKVTGRSLKRQAYSLCIVMHTSNKEMWHRNMDIHQPGKEQACSCKRMCIRAES